MTTAPELVANGLNGLSIVLAGRNSVHTWWVGILGCFAFAWVFYDAKLYADVLLQVFFVVTSIAGWWRWADGGNEVRTPIRSVEGHALALVTTLGVVVTLGYAWLLRRLTDAAAPLTDSAVLAFSVIAQFLLIGRRIETWWFWLLVNTLAVPLFVSRGLYVTALLYSGFWMNALLSLRHWRKLSVEAR